MDVTDRPWMKHGYKAAQTICQMANDIKQIRRRAVDSSPIRILHLIETSGPGGAERMLLSLIRKLGSEYHSTLGLLKPGWLQSQALLSGMSCAMINRNGPGDLGVIAHLLQVVREHKSQVIHSHEFYMNAVGAMISRLTGIPLVVTVHGKSYYPEKRRRGVIYRMVAAQATKVVAVSQDLQRFFCQTTGVQTKHVQVIYNGVDTNYITGLKRVPELLEPCGIPSEACIVGAIGNLYPVKGHIHLIRAARIILQHRSDVHVVILGRGGLHDTLRAEAETLGIQQHIHLLGYREDASRWLRMMDVFTLPSLSEGLPLALLEAMAAGIPTVVTHVGGIPEVVSDDQTGLLVPPESPESLASRIVFLLENPAAAVSIGAASRSRVQEQFSLEKMVREYCDLYQKALTSRSIC